MRTRNSAIAALVAGAFALTAASATAAPDDGPSGAVDDAATQHHPSGGGRDRGTPVTEQSLRELAEPTGVAIGAAINTDALRDDPEYRAIAEREFDSVTAENVMKWEVLEPERGEYDYSEADYLVDFAAENDMAVRGHVLIWHNQVPTWVVEGYESGDISKRQLRRIVRRHVIRTARHFRGEIYEWDVVNEYFLDDGTVRPTLWTEALGEDYIFDVFRWARRGDPRAKLYYNDYNLFYEGPKSDAAYDLMQEFRRRRVPIDGIGFQGHVGLQYGLNTTVYDNMQRFAGLGLDLSVTEADVRYLLPEDVYETAAQEQGYHMLLQACLLTTRCNSFTVWGISDQYSWIPDVFPEEGNALLWTAEYEPKPAYQGVQFDFALAGQRDLRRTPIRPTP